LIARKTHARVPAGIDYDDLVSAGVMGLMDAVDRYDPARGVPFKAFAKHRIQGAILDSLRATDWVPRAVRRRAEGVSRARHELRARLGREPAQAEVAEHLGVDLVRLQTLSQDMDLQPLLSLDAPLDPEDGPALVDRVVQEGSLEQDLEQAEQKAQLAAAIDHLPEREKAVIILCYFRELTLREVGEVLGVSESRACQLSAQAIRRLQTRLRPVRS
jgi:RNA polymerase sigma factor for flagellar operon FliA